MIQPNEARQLCSESEWKLVESSFSPMLETLPRSDLKSRMDRIRKLHRKSTDLAGLQRSDSRTARRNTELFTEAIARFEATLNVLKNYPASKNVDNDKSAETARTVNMHALQDRTDQELDTRKRQLLPALGLRGEQQGQKSGARHIQSHVGSVTRRKQTRRDSKNR